MAITDKICERPDPGPCPPMVMPKNLSGFPKPKEMTKPTTRTDSVPDANTFTMSAREAAKLEWTNPVEEEPSSTMRYDFNGNIVTTDPDDYTRELYHHGSEPSKPGYSLSELFHLSQSGFPAQKTLAIRAIGAIGRGQCDRSMHRILVGEWNAHIRCSVACSDTSVSVREAAIEALLTLIEGVDKQCGCIVSDLASIPEFLRAFDADNEVSVKVFLYICNSQAVLPGGLEVIPEEDETEALRDFILESGEKFGLEVKNFKCGVSAREYIQKSESLDEMIATLCDRLACANQESISDSDIVFFESKLAQMHSTQPLFSESGDEFSWTSRCNLVAQALTESTGTETVMMFMAKICWLFTSSLFPLECRASIWGNSELVQNISRVMSASDSFKLLGNHAEIDFHMGDILELHRDKAMILRAIKNACTRFLADNDSETSIEMATAAQGILAGPVGKI